MTATTSEPTIDQREEIKANDIEIIVRVPGQPEVVTKIDARATGMDSPAGVASAVAEIVERLLEA